MILTHLVDTNIVVLSKVDFKHFCTKLETRPIQFNQIEVRLSQIVIAGVRLVLLDTQARYVGGWWLRMVLIENKSDTNIL